MRQYAGYDRVAWCYDAVAQIFSGGAIDRSKLHQLRFIKEDDSVLFLGSGEGAEAVEAAASGAKVTCIDASTAMLSRLERKLRLRGAVANLICSDALSHNRPAAYDVVAVNYFLNCFAEAQMESMLAHAKDQVRPGGLIMIADVALPQGNFAARAINLAYLKTAMASFCLMGLVPWHKNYDYAAFLNELGMNVTDTKFFRLMGLGPIVFQNIVARKSAS